ncbi:MAG: DUF1249 domain-containing protein [Pseudomonadota bacterium]
MSISAEASTNVYCGHRPVRLAALMELYERNFLMVEQLVPELELPFDTAISRCATDLPLHLTTLERSRYTCAFKLTYEFTDERGTRCDPDLQLRVYRDARVVEALRCVTRPPWQADGEGDPQVERFLSAQWSRNLLLYKWLVYLLGHGHGFGMAGRPRDRALSSAPA